MPSLKTIKLRIKSVKSTQKITKAMKMVAASKLKRARENAEGASVYASMLNNLVQALASSVPADATPIKLMHGTGNDKTHMLIVVTSDRGLCGSFNHGVMKLVKRTLRELESQNKVVKLVCFGKKGYDMLKGEHKSKIVKYFDTHGEKDVASFENAKKISEFITAELQGENFDYCHVFFNKFKSVIAQEPTRQQLIPLVLDEECMAQHGVEFEPSEEEILEMLLPKNITTQLFASLLESSASEQAARMTAMDNATRNSGEMIKKLNLVYNRTRQAYITKELIEIISGAEAV